MYGQRTWYQLPGGKQWLSHFCTLIRAAPLKLVTGLLASYANYMCKMILCVVNFYLVWFLKSRSLSNVQSGFRYYRSTLEPGTQYPKLVS
jgi:hypothetical protein